MERPTRQSIVHVPILTVRSVSESTVSRTIGVGVAKHAGVGTVSTGSRSVVVGFTYGAPGLAGVWLPHDLDASGAVLREKLGSVGRASEHG